MTLVSTVGLVAVTACNTSVTDDRGTGGGAAQCSGFEDTTDVADFVVTVRNNTAKPIFLSGRSCEPDIDLRLYDDSDQQVSFHPGVCHYTCAQLQETVANCPAGCAIPKIIMIAPGGSYALQWNGTVHQPVAMAAACYFGAEYASDTCEKRIVAPAGGYAFEVSGHDDSWCPLDQPGACACTPDANGSCVVEQYGEIPSDAGTRARGQFTFPGTSAEIVFDA